MDEILFYQPDIVLIDLLFPHTDGIRIMKRAMSRGAVGHFIMISQAHDKNMEEMAYKEGIDFFVHKPINVLEIRKVLQNVIQIMEMERMLSAVRQAVTPAAAGPAADDSEQRLRDFVDDIKYVSHVHISEPGLEPIVPRQEHKELAMLLKAVGYSGDVSIEMKRTDVETVRKTLAYIAEVFA